MGEIHTWEREDKPGKWQLCSATPSQAVMIQQKKTSVSIHHTALSVHLCQRENSPVLCEHITLTTMQRLKLDVYIFNILIISP